MHNINNFFGTCCTARAHNTIFWPAHLGSFAGNKPGQQKKDLKISIYMLQYINKIAKEQ
jgi:hypothetical protein